jgi:hypothetical protein
MYINRIQYVGIRYICVIATYEIDPPKWANTSWKLTGVAVGLKIYNSLTEIVQLKYLTAGKKIGGCSSQIKNKNKKLLL